VVDALAAGREPGELADPGPDVVPARPPGTGPRAVATT
jgi:hypothetical protein